ncbi:MAG: sigma-70 family RNA polymerase sigma factor [Candidatus Omnitrophica bacterium]|nr:sigma-70 family RNA polymerase sigma factor [Candidatus Omnitrophota bacterium]
MTDKEWIRQALAEYEGPLLRYVHRIVGDLETARDVVQDAFLKMCSARPEKVKDHVAPWLYTVCRNRALDIQRKESRMNPISDEMMATAPHDAPIPSEKLEAEERESQVLAFLSKLPDNQQEVIRLKFQDGLSYKEISEITGNTVSYVGVLIHNGMKTLRENMAQLAREVS